MTVTNERMRRSIRLSGLVERYHTHPTITRQSVAEHTWQVLRIYIEIFGAPSPGATVAIMYHDSPEIATGDAPFPVKSNYPMLKTVLAAIEYDTYIRMGIVMPTLDSSLVSRIKVCDLLEMWEFGKHEVMLGNQYAHSIVADTMYAAMAIPMAPEDAALVRTWIDNHESRGDTL